MLAAAVALKVALKAKKNERPNPVDVDVAAKKPAKLAKGKQAKRKRGEVAAAAAAAAAAPAAAAPAAYMKTTVEQKRRECEQLEAEINVAKDARDYTTCVTLTRGLGEAMGELEVLEGKLDVLEAAAEQLEAAAEQRGAVELDAVVEPAVVEDDDNSHGQQGATVLAARSQAVLALKVFQDTVAAAAEVLGQECVAVEDGDYTGAATLKTEHDTKLGLCSVQAKAAKAAIDRHSNLLANQQKHQLSALQEALRKEECAVQDMVSKLPWRNDGDEGLEARLAMVGKKIGEVEMALQPLHDLELAMRQTMQKEKTAAEHEESRHVLVNPEIAKVMKRFLSKPSMPTGKRLHRATMKTMTPTRRNVATEFQPVAEDEVEEEEEEEV